MILYNTKTNYNNFEICYGVSSYNKPDNNWNAKFIANLSRSKTRNYQESYLKSAYTINSLEDLTFNFQSIIKDIEDILVDYKDNFLNVIKHKVDTSSNVQLQFRSDTKIKLKNARTQPLNQILYGPPCI